MSDKSTQDFLRNKGILTSIPVASIIADPIFQMREDGTDDVIVRRYAEIMGHNNPNGWQIFPRITVLALSDTEDERYDPEKYYVIGGNHRLAAMQDQEYEHIEAIVILGTTTDGIVFAAGENDDKSVRRTLKDIRRAVLSCLKHPEIKDWVNPKIAEICAVDVQTVRNWEIWLYKNDPDYSRPEKLKFRDKYGGVSLRKHSIPNFAVEPEVIEIEEKRKAETAIINLRSQLSPKHETIIAYTTDPNPELQDQRETDLLTRFPDLSLYKLLESLSHDDLVKLETALIGAVEFVRQEKKNVQDELRDIRYNGLKLTRLPHAMENHDVILRKRQKALHDRFPAFKQYNDRSIWDLAFAPLLAIRDGLIECRDYLAEHGDKEFLPPEYFDIQQAMDQAEKDTAAREQLIKQFVNIQRTIEEQLLRYVEQRLGVEEDALSYQAEDLVWSVFKEKYNQSCANADAGDMKILKKMEERSDWDIKRKTDAYSLEKLQDYMRRWCAVLKWIESTVLNALEGGSESAQLTQIRYFFDDYITALQIRMSSIEIQYEGFGRVDMGKHTITPKIPLSRDDLARIVKASQEAVNFELDEIMEEYQQDSEAKVKATPKSPDPQGLRGDIYDLLDAGDLINAPALSHTYNVPLNQVESIIDQAKTDFEMEAEEKRKKTLMNEYDDLSSEGWALWSKHLQRFITWDGLFASAQSNWIALKNSHDYSPAEDSEESLKLQIAIWKNFKADLEYTIRVINNQSVGERGEIWLLKLLTIKVDAAQENEEKQPEQMDARNLPTFKTVKYAKG